MKAACCEFRNRGVAGRIAFYLALIALPKTVNAKPLKHATHLVVAELGAFDTGAATGRLDRRDLAK